MVSGQNTLKCSNIIFSISRRYLAKRSIDHFLCHDTVSVTRQTRLHCDTSYSRQKLTERVNVLSKCATQSGKFTACSKLLVTYLALISILTITKSVSVMVPATTKHFDRPGKIHRLQILLFNQLLNWWEHYVWHSCLSL